MQKISNKREEYTQKCFLKLKNKILNESNNKEDYFQAFRYYNTNSNRWKFFAPIKEMLKNNQILPLNNKITNPKVAYVPERTVNSKPSQHPWLTNMRYLFRECFKGNYKELISFLNWCVSTHRAPWRGYVVKYLEEKKIALRNLKAKIAAKIVSFGSQEHLKELFKNKDIGSVRSVLAEKLRLEGTALKKATQEIKQYLAENGYAPVGIFKGKFSSYPVFYLKQIKSAFLALKVGGY